MFRSFFPDHIQNVDNVYNPDNSINEQKLSYLLHYIQSDTRRMRTVLRYLRSRLFAEYRATGRMATGLKILSEIMTKFALNSMSYEIEMLKIIFAVIRSNAISAAFLLFCHDFFGSIEIRTYKSEVLAKRILLFVCESSKFEDTSSDESVQEEMNYYVSDHATNLFFINCILDISGIFNNDFQDKFDNILSYLMGNYDDMCVLPIVKCIKSINIVNSEYFIDRYICYSVRYSLDIYQLLFDNMPEPGFLHILSAINKKLICEIDEYNFRTLIFWGKKFTIKSNVNIPDVSKTFGTLLEVYLNNCRYELQQFEDSYTTINTNRFVDFESLCLFETVGHVKDRAFKNNEFNYNNFGRGRYNLIYSKDGGFKGNLNCTNEIYEKTTHDKFMIFRKRKEEFIAKQEMIRAFYLQKKRILNNSRFRAIYEYFSMYVKQNPYASEIFYFFIKGNDKLFFMFFIIDKMRYLNFKMDLNLVIALISAAEKFDILQELIFEIFRMFEPFFVEKTAFEKILGKIRSLYFQTKDENLAVILNKYNLTLSDSYNFRADERNYDDLLKGNNYFDSRRSSISIETLKKKRKSHICNYNVL